MIMGERVWDQRIRFLFVVAQMMGINFFVWRSYWKGKNWWWEDFAKPLPFHPQTLEVTFTTFEGVTCTHHPQKGHKLTELPDLSFFCEFSTLVFIMMVGKCCFTLLLPSITRTLFRCKSSHMGGWLSWAAECPWIHWAKCWYLEAHGLKGFLTWTNLEGLFVFKQNWANNQNWCPKLTWPMAKRLKLFGITYLVGKVMLKLFFFRVHWLSEKKVKQTSNSWYCWWFRNPILNHRLDGAKTL